MNQIRDLRGAKERDNAQLAFFITLEKSKPTMDQGALSAGFYQAPSGVGRRVQAIQIRTIEELLAGHNFDFPLYGSNVSFRQAAAEESGKQEGLEF